MPRVFKVHSCIGRGGFGEVYLASVYADGAETHSVALKILHADVDPRSHAVQRLRDECRMLRALDHASILKAEELAVIDGRVALVTEYIEGEDLAGLAKKSPLPTGPALEIVERIADALHDAQTHEVDGAPLDLVHRDVKPANIRIGHDGAVRLLDFGVARTERLDREAETATDVVMGSLPFLAPEILTTGHSAHPSDVYALGVTLFFALTGQRLFPEPGPELFGLLLHAERFDSRIEQRLTHIEDPEVAELVRSLTRREPETRPSHAEARDRARALRQGRGPSLASYCASCTWPDPKSLPGLLAGRVIEEELVDPRSINAPTTGENRPVDPDGHNVTEITDFSDDSDDLAAIARRAALGAPTELRPPSPAYVPPEPALPPRSATSPASTRPGGPSRIQLAAAVVGIALLMTLGFVGAFAAGTMLLP